MYIKIKNSKQLLNSNDIHAEEFKRKYTDVCKLP